MDNFSELIGTRLSDLPAPSAVIDKSVVKRNCKQMLSICDSLGTIFRAHIKTHKVDLSNYPPTVDEIQTAELTSIMTDADAPASERSYVSIVVSTTLEAFHVLPLLKAAQSVGKRVSVLFGIPLPSSRIPDLIRLSNHLGPDTVAVMIDHPAQLDALRAASPPGSTDFHPSLFIKIDTGYGRAGVPDNADSATLKVLCGKARDLQKDGLATMLGFYSHGGDSYGVNDASSAFAILAREIRGLLKIRPVAESVDLKPGPGKKGFVLSVGATPTIKSAWLASTGLEEYRNSEAHRLIKEAEGHGDEVEFHAGNYPVLDMQQFATNAGLSSAINSQAQSSTNIPPTGLEDIGLSILAEVNSVYSERETEECLVTAGCLALGREPCKSYAGWGVVSDWPHGKGMQKGSGWYIHSISQEHGKMKVGDVPGVATKASARRSWAVGERLRIWPNHACIAGTNFPVYFVVDRDDASGGDVVKEVWTRCRGW